MEMKETEASKRRFVGPGAPRGGWVSARYAWD
ncbi:hypothetical protein BamMEX5DRAFT_6785 [Burkholderia ambifaria MEX-5]|uniref:Uncharacterized protein n=1 Tax=Burkholderia ambifaria MEX-5 TaxID=396597 RepID=B1TG69_9BURK|nr:hypothetical protein BamMEX5DRAFT_6785 [Burkholderia ambifaria MEX-5]